VLVADEKARAQIDRILESETFRFSEVLRHLLWFLADKAFSGESDQLKEYTIGLDALGKPTTYDPRQDASVRLQAGRLRQKLTEYYLNEGKSDPVVFELPKGHFKLTWKTRAPIDPSHQVGPAIVPSATAPHRLAVILLCCALLITSAWSVYSTVRLWQARGTSSRQWTPELEQLWRPFIATNRPMIISLADPFFVSLAGKDGRNAFYFRDRSIERWEEAIRSPQFAAVQKLLGSPQMRVDEDFALRGDIMSLFLLTRLLAGPQPNLSVFRLSAVSADDLSNNNILFIGSQRGLSSKLLGLPLPRAELIAEADGIRNLHPRQGERSFFPNEVSTSTEGEVFALVSMVPGPIGNNVVESITSGRTWGNMGAVQFLTDPAFARILVKKLQTPSGSIPRYYQIVLKVRYRNGVSTEISYMMHRDLSSSP